MLIGLAGAAGAGKGSVANVLVTGAGFVEIAFADPIYEAVAAITGISVAKLKDRRIKETVIPWLGKSPRQLLQLLGTEFGRNMIRDSIWVDRAMRTADWHDSIGAHTVITDARFDNEAEAVRGRGGVIWQVVRETASCLADDTARHASEAGIRPELVDLVIDNNGTLEDLYGTVATALREATECYNEEDTSARTRL